MSFGGAQKHAIAHASLPPFNPLSSSPPHTLCTTVNITTNRQLLGAATACVVGGALYSLKEGAAFADLADSKFKW